MDTITYYTLSIVLTTISLIMICAFGITLLIIYNKHKKILENLTTYEIDISATIDEEIPRILDIFVHNVFSDYRAMYLEAQDIGYIDTEKEKEITKEVSKLCAERLSNAMVHKLSLFWKPQSIGSVIADKVYLTVVAYVADHNKVQDINDKK